MGFHRPGGSTRQLAAVPVSFGCGPSGPQLRRKELENAHISFVLAPRIGPDGVTPFRPNQQVLTLVMIEMQDTSAHDTGPLAGCTVIELGHSVAAPFAGMILADLGARVVKVENPADGDYARGWGPPFWRDTSSLFAALNRGKESVAIDFRTEEGVRRLRDLILGEADAVIQNLRPGVLDRFGIGADDLCAAKPSLIWCNIGAFGPVGPLARKPGYDPLAQASTGIMSVTGEAGRSPVRVGVSLVDIGAGMWSVIGLLASLFERENRKKGAVVSTSLYETGLSWMTVPLAGYAAAGEVRGPQGSGSAEIVPYQAFNVGGEWIMIAAGNDNLFGRLCRALGQPQLADDPAYRTNADRVKNRAALIAGIEAAIAGFDMARLSAALDAEGVPSAPLLTVDRVLAHAQTLALNMGVPHGQSELVTMGIPLTFDGVRFAAQAEAPALGQSKLQAETAFAPQEAAGAASLAGARRV
ncbi:MAG: CoA transferase [Rhizobiaceae bacterium]|nr:CoA transferase [Rhizobiaceae bacterium]